MNHLHIIQLAQERAAELQGKRLTAESWSPFARRRSAGQGLFATLRHSLNLTARRTPKDNKRARS
jgi:hypothetical protein